MSKLLTGLLAYKIPNYQAYLSLFKSRYGWKYFKRFSLSGIEIPRYGGACPRWNVYSAFTRPGVIQSAVSKMTNGEKYVCIARTVEKVLGDLERQKVFYPLDSVVKQNMRKILFTQKISI